MQVDSVNKPGILLEVVQILSDIDLIITKAYISSDGGWFMDGTCLNFHIYLGHLGCKEINIYIYIYVHIS